MTTTNDDGLRRGAKPGLWTDPDYRCVCGHLRRLHDGYGGECLAEDRPSWTERWIPCPCREVA